MNFFLNTNFIIEHSSSHKMSDFIKENIGKVSNPALIYDSILSGQAHFDKALKNLKIAFPRLDIKVNDRQGEPTYKYLNKLANYFRGKDIDIVVAIGGGSTMDIGKGIAFLLTNKGNALEYKGFPKDANNPIPLVTCPSLFGSGADISYNAVFIDEDEGKKLGINSTKNFPKLTIIDSELTMEAPESAVISSAMDTLVHCIDSFGSVKHTPMSRMHSIAGFRDTFKVLYEGTHMDINSRNNLAKGAICGITALMNSGDGPTNGFAYYLGVKHNVPHGLAGAIFLKEVMNYNINQGYEDYCMLTSLSSDDMSNVGDDIDIANISSHLIHDFDFIYNNLKIPNLSKYGFTKNDMNTFVQGSMDALSGSFGGNPVEFSENAVRRVYKNLIIEK